MINVILFGTGKASLIVKSSLKSETNILCYCDNNKNKWNEIHEEKIVISPEEITNFDYDYVIIASQFNATIYNQLISLGINKKKIFQFYVYLDYCSDIITNKIKNFISEKNCEVVATGLSYMDYALAASDSITNLFNFANASQDLFYDYSIIKFIYDNYNEKFRNIKCVLIGISYYSFQYDMSLSAMKDKVPFYYKAIGLSHNFHEVNKISEMIEINNKIAKKLLKLNEKNYPNINWYNDVEQRMHINEAEGKKQAELDCSKNYPKTVGENFRILSKYLSMLNDNDIQPIILICPTSEYYYKNFSEKMIKEFNDNINKLKKKHHFEVVDLFKVKGFFDDDFYDVSHLNYIGSKKFLNILRGILANKNINLE